MGSTIQPTTSTQPLDSEEDNQIHEKKFLVRCISATVMYCSVYRLPVDTPLCCSLDKGQSRLLKATSSDLRVAVDMALLDAQLLLEKVFFRLDCMTSPPRKVIKSVYYEKTC